MGSRHLARMMCAGTLLMGSFVLAQSQPSGPKKKDEKGARMPWLAAHFDEVDANKDGILTSDELKEVADRTFKAFDKNGDGKLVKDEYDVPRPDVKSALAGFVRGHAEEIDANRDGVITREELQAVLTKMFEKADRSKAGKITRAEAAGKK